MFTKFIIYNVMFSAIDAERNFEGLLCKRLQILTQPLQIQGCLRACFFLLSSFCYQYHYMFYSPSRPLAYVL